MKLPRYAQLFQDGEYRYRVLYGGRGSAKSQTIATLLLLRGASKKMRILCLREIMESIADSSHKLLKDIIEENPKLSAHYTVTKSSIRGLNGTEFIFKGLRYNVTEIKGIQGIDIAWVEEAANVSENSWQILIPTIRQEGSQIWVSFNPENEDSATYKRFIESPPSNGIVLKVNFDQNPFFPNVLRDEMENDRVRDYNKYLHIWEGELKNNTEAQIFKNAKVEKFDTPHDAQFLYGVDWGFAVDPTTMVRLYIIGKTIYVDHEAFMIGCEIEKLPELFDTVEGSRDYVIRCDNARPELINYVARHGFKAVAAMKWAGSVEDGVEAIKSYDVIIHERCKNTAKEFAKYSYKTHRLTGDILPQIEDANNHCIDAIRYSLTPIIYKPRFKNPTRSIAI